MKKTESSLNVVISNALLGVDVIIIFFIFFSSTLIVSFVTVFKLLKALDFFPRFCGQGVQPTVPRKLAKSFK